MRHGGRVGEIALGFSGTEAGVVPGKDGTVSSSDQWAQRPNWTRGEGSQQRIGFGTEAGTIRSGIGSLLGSSTGTEAKCIDGSTDAVPVALR